MIMENVNMGRNVGKKDMVFALFLQTRLLLMKIMIVF